MRHIFAIMITAIFLLFPSHGFTQDKEIVSEGAYNMGDGETLTVAESRALLNAKRVGVEQAATYVESYTKVEKFQLTKDEIQVLTSGIMEVEILDKKRTIVGDGFRFWVKIKAMVNPDRIQEMAKKVKEKSVVEDYKKIQEAYEKSQKDIEELKKQLAQAKGEKERKQVEAKIIDDERLFQANEWFAKGYQHDLNKDYDKAIEAYTSAITLNQNNAEAYNNRGAAYGSKGQNETAFENFNKALSISPNKAAVYYNRGLYYAKKNQYEKAIDDFNKVIAIAPNYLGAYTMRGLVNVMKGKYDRAIEDFNRAIALNPNDAQAYENRGNAYSKMGQHDRAIENYNAAIAIHPNKADTYTLRGLVYAIKGLIDSAISDFQKACDMGSENGCKTLQIVLKKR